MESGLYLSIITSWEVIAVCLFVMFLLPLVFFVASTKSRRRIPLRVTRIRRPPKRTPAVSPQEPAEVDDRDVRPSGRRGERPEDTEDDT
jgi:hypothetical protein